MGKNDIYIAYLFENFEKNVLEVKTLKDIIYGVLMENIERYFSQGMSISKQETFMSPHRSYNLKIGSHEKHSSIKN